MSARHALLTALRAALPAATFRVSDSISAPDQVDVGKSWVVVLTEDVTPGPTLGTLTYKLTVWLLSGNQDPAVVDDRLDDALDDLLAALLGIRSVAFVSAERSTADDLYHGFKLTVNAYATTA